MNATYRSSQSDFWLLACSLAGLFLFGIVATVAAIALPPEVTEIPPDHLVAFVVLCGGVPTTIACLCALGWLVSWRHSLSVTDACIVDVGLRRTAEIALDDVVEARWGSWANKQRLFLKTGTARLGIELSRYTAEQQRQLIRFLRGRLPEAVQHGWEKFWQFNWRVFDEPDRSDPELVAAKQRAARRRMDALFLLGLLIVLLTAALAWHWTHDREAMGPAGTMVLLLLLWIPIRRRIEIPGRVGEKLPADGQVNWAITGSITVMLLSFVAFAVGAAMDIPLKPSLFIQTLLLSVVLLSLPVFFWGLWRQDRRMKTLRDQGAQMAAQLYMSSTTRPARPEP